MKKIFLFSVFLLSLTTVFSSAGWARVKSIEILKIEPYAKGQYSGAYGPYGY